MDEARRPSPRADLIGGVAWIVFGGAIVVASWTMDRLESFGATLHTVPGLVPGLLGAMIVLLGGLLVARSLRRSHEAARTLSADDQRLRADARRRAAIATALALAYTLVLIGRVPFTIATFAFVFAFIMVFDVSPDAPRPPGRRALFAAITAIATTAIVAFVFERIFLVRLP